MPVYMGFIKNISGYVEGPRGGERRRRRRGRDEAGPAVLEALAGFARNPRAC